MKLFEKSSIGELVMKNRFWRSATWLGLASDDGHMTSELFKRYEELAVGGVGTIITGFAVVAPDEQPYPRMLNLTNDEMLKEHIKLTDMVHSHGTNIIMQIGYGGSTRMNGRADNIIWGPSAVVNPSSKVTPTEMTKEHITKFLEYIGETAKRAKAAGYDGVQLHAAHGYLLSQFLSPYFNVRTDEYGGSIENRSRIIFEAIKSICEYCGEDYPIFIKMHCDDLWEEKGLTEDESLWLAKSLEQNKIAGIEFSGGNIDPENKNGATLTRLSKVESQSYFKEQTTRIANELNIPIILVGGNRNFELMEEILNQTKIDYFALSRPLHSEPDLPNKWMKDDKHKPRCVSCNNCWTKDGNICILDRRARGSN